MSLLEVDRLSVTYGQRDRWGRRVRLEAVRAVSLRLEAGETVGLVGESGSGKSSLGRALLGLEPGAAGGLRFRGREVAAMGRAERAAFHREVQVVFQDPLGSLNPRLTVGGALEEVLHVHRIGLRTERRARAARLLEQVGLGAEALDRYPHEFSGGQRQRIGIARALATSPALLIADEPVSALDVSVQVQILNLLKDLQERMGMALLFIAHDLAVVRYMCRRVLVLYRGELVEQGETEAVLSAPQHPHTAALRAAVLGV
jgi:ABC-type glutathione transport system ATPase component